MVYTPEISGAEARAGERLGDIDNDPILARIELSMDAGGDEISRIMSAGSKSANAGGEIMGFLAAMMANGQQNSVPTVTTTQEHNDSTGPIIASSIAAVGGAVAGIAGAAATKKASGLAAAPTAQAQPQAQPQDQVQITPPQQPQESPQANMPPIKSKAPTLQNKKPKPPKDKPAAPVVTPPDNQPSPVAGTEPLWKKFWPWSAVSSPSGNDVGAGGQSPTPIQTQPDESPTPVMCPNPSDVGPMKEFKEMPPACIV